MRKRNKIIFFAFIYLVTIAMMLIGSGQRTFSGDDLTAMCLESSLPCMEITSPDDVALASEQTETEPEQKAETVSKSKNTGDPKVLIYHTHATESYLPSYEGNYHTTAEKNTVRDVGNVLAEALEKEGIGVVHDKTIHDNPSYDNSYTRSYETVEALLKKYPTVECIIDLHRDATAAKIDGPVQTVDGKTCAVYSYVISNTTATYDSNKALLSKLNQIGNSKYEGYTGKILERPYWYNQELSGKSILLEMGNNRNNIEEVRKGAEVFAKILAEAL